MSDDKPDFPADRSEKHPDGREPATPSAEAERNSTHDKEVTLAVTSPFWTTHFNCDDGDGGTLSIDRTGTVVPRSALRAIFDAAAKSGVALTEVSD